MSEDMGGWPEDPLGGHGFGDPADPADYHSLDGGPDGLGDHPAGYDETSHGFAADGWNDPDAGVHDSGTGDGYWPDYTDGTEGAEGTQSAGDGHGEHGVAGDHGSSESSEQTVHSVQNGDTVHSVHDADGIDGGGEVADPTSEDPSLLDSEHPAQPVDAETFPPRLELDVSPTDGRDWVDVDLLGSGEEWGTMSMADTVSDSVSDPLAGVVVPDSPQALLADLHQFDGGDGMPSWTAVAGSDDPAVRALALHWQTH